MFVPTINKIGPFGVANPYKAKPVVESPTEDTGGTPRFINYVADYGGCGFWRVMWPEYLLNADSKCIVNTSTLMSFDIKYYQNARAVKIQRQASTAQKMFVHELRKMADQFKFRLIYEIDDIPFREDIPDYNKYKPSFNNDEIRNNIKDIIETCGNMSVTCNFMKDYFASKVDKSVKIDVIPNYIPKFWMGNYYNREKIELNYEQFKSKPRIVWAGSAAHFDIDNRVKGKDDFHHINQIIRKTVDDFQWVMYGCVSRDLIDLVKQGKIEFVHWSKLFEYPEKLNSLNANMFIAPLVDNNFNKSKSDLKYLEASTLGIPIACQDICTYENAPIKFKTGEEMIDQIKIVLGDERRYIKESINGRKFAETRFLETESNLYKFYDNYMYNQGDPRRKYLKP
jgi:O-antigen biosynthesis protein